MPYQIKEIFYSLQGEGVHAGRPAVFCRFAGCNLWSGRESDRSTARCSFCDTDFVGTDGPNGGNYASPADVVRTVASCWPRAGRDASPYVICTGGEPLLQLDPPLIDAFHAAGMSVAVETNGTQPVHPGLDWVTVSPKAGSELCVLSGDELKLVYPQSSLDPSHFENLHFTHFVLQPMDGSSREENTRQARDYCLQHPRWRLSLQIHKILGLP
jgi:7-carboxy-7-deazaguanine synthase